MAEDYTHLGIDPRGRKIGGISSFYQYAPDGQVVRKPGNDSDSFGFIRRMIQEELRSNPYSLIKHRNQAHRPTSGISESGGGSVVIAERTGGTTCLSIDPTTGALSQTGDTGITGDLSVSGAVSTGGTTLTGAYSKSETGYQIAQAERQWTEENTWTDVNGSKFKLNGDSFALTNTYFEVLGCVEKSGKTASYRLYNTTDGTALTESQISTTSVGVAPEYSNAQVIRSGTLAIPSGVKEFKMQFKHSDQGGEGTTSQLLKGQLIFVSS